MKQNELFNKCCENIDPKTREEVWKQMDKELGREENRGNSSKIPSNSPKKTLEQAAGDYIVQLNGEDLEGGFNAAFNAFKAGAEWQKKQKPADLEKEIENKRRTMLLNLFGPMNGEQGLAIRNFARHFYELGLKRKEE